MELLEAIYQRRAVRAYKPQAVDRDLIDVLIDAAIQAPSAVNSQPWHFSIIRDASLLASIADTAKAHMLERLAKDAGAGHFHEQLGDPNFQIFYHAPVLIVISANSGDWVVEDATLAAQNLMLAACDLGLGTCWIGFAQSWLRTTEGRATLCLPDGYLPVAPIIVGHPQLAAPVVPRKPTSVDWRD